MIEARRTDPIEAAARALYDAVWKDITLAKPWDEYQYQDDYRRFAGIVLDAADAADETPQAPEGEGIMKNIVDVLFPRPMETRVYRRWYLLCREAMERDGGPQCERVLRHIGPRTSKREDFEREFWGDLPPSS